MKFFVCFSVFALIVIAMFSCSKSKDSQLPIDQGKKYPINFNVASFSQSISDLKSKSVNIESISTDSLKKIVKFITFWVFAKNGQLNRPVVIQSADTSLNFGSFSDSLPYGGYTAYFNAVGANLTGGAKVPGESEGGFGPIGPYNDGIAFAAYIGTGNYTYWMSDAFTASVDFNITGEPVNENVDLKRIVGKVDLKINDANANPGVDFAAYTNTFGENYSNKTDSTSLAGGSNALIYFKKIAAGEFVLYQSAINKPFNVTIVADIGGVKQTKTISNVVCYRNKKTTLSGEFFDSSGSSDFSPNFSMNIDPTWSADSILINY